MRRPKTKEDKALHQALDVLIAKSGHSPEAIMGDQGLLAQLTKRLVERVLGAELTHHLKTGRNPAEQAVDEQGERVEPADLQEILESLVTLGRAHQDGEKFSV